MNMDIFQTSSARDDACEALAIERRSAGRVRCDLETTCQPITGPVAMSWPARAVEISTSGIALVLGRRFEPGAMLTVRLTSADDHATRMLFLRVVHVARQVAGTWRLGCAFVSELTEEELETFQAQRLRPAEPDNRAWVRFACDVETQCRAVAPAHFGTWPARILDVSPGGMSLLTPYQYEQGTILNIKLPDGTTSSPRFSLVRVVGVRPIPPDQWILGCEFSDQLSDEDLKRFQ